MLDTEKLMRYARLFSARKKLKMKYEALGKEIEAQEQGLIAHLAENQVDRVNLTGGFVVYFDTKIWPKLLVSREKVVEALKEAGHGDIVAENFNTNSLASWLRELDAGGEDVPEELRSVLEKNEVTSLLVKKFK
jgi:hypothetical protein